VTLSIALFQPDIPQNTGTILRLAACLGVPAEIIEPAGFPVSDRAFRRAGMDYLDQVSLTRHVSWTAFEADRRARARRLVLATTRGEVAYTDFQFSPGDTILLGRESAGVPEVVHAAADARVVVPLLPALRSLNIAVAAAMILGEALRQTGGFPPLHT
jgi:tRNA (cytidine/uridine-2'-O-)-methyltransferase